MHVDTLALSRRLKKAGFTEMQVDALIDLTRKTALDSRCTSLAAGLDQQFTIFEQWMTVRLGGMIVAAVAFTVLFLGLAPPAS